MRLFLILSLVLALCVTNGAEAACSSASGRSGLFSRLKARREARVEAASSSCGAASASSCGSR